ncbi:DUF465 domain-containing protein [bacterium]|nr:DUF465 domain-containing protein [bacterium]
MSLKKTSDLKGHQDLIQSDFELRKLAKDHQKFEKRLEDLNKQKFLNDHDEREMKKIQKMKLVLKDQMMKRLSVIN